jgi:hypothetical protein
MKRKTILLAAAALSALAFAALPSAAGAFKQPPVSGAAGHEFHGTSTNTVGLFGGTEFQCKGTEAVPQTITTTGIFETDDTGSVKFTFHNCREQTFNTTCTSAGEKSGTITTTTLPFHTTYLEPKEGGTTHERPGILITPNSSITAEHFATFKCAGGFVTVVVKGNGLLGTVTEPRIGDCAGKSNSMKINISATPSAQEHTTTHTTGTKYGLTVSVNGGAFAPTYLNLGSNTVSFTEGFEGTTTTETTP